MHESTIRRPRPPLQTSTLVLNVLLAAAALLGYGWYRWPQIQDPAWAASWTEAVGVSLGTTVAVSVLMCSLLTLLVRPFDKARRIVAEAQQVPLVELTLIRPAVGRLDPLDVALAAFEQPVRTPKYRAPVGGTRVTSFAETEQEKTEPRLFTHDYQPRHLLALDGPLDRDV